MPVDVADTNTRHLPVEELTQEVIAELDDAAARFLAGEFHPARDQEPAKVLPRPYRGEHRLNEDYATRRITPVVVGQALAPRTPGAELAGSPPPPPVPAGWPLLGRLLAGSRRLLGGRRAGA